MAYQRRCHKCGAMLDAGEICMCDSEQGAVLAVGDIPPLASACIERKPTMQEQARELDRAVWAAAVAYRAEKRNKKRRRR